jgi:hypothetical protein
MPLLQVQTSMESETYVQLVFDKDLVGSDLYVI